MFRPGDVVRLKSGGPALTVEEARGVGCLHPATGAYPGQECLCAWFDPDDGLMRSVFNANALEKTDADDYAVLRAG
jgi:uncharacterized protein YodC (DUF2158 family)